MISVVIPVYNRPDLVKRAIDSVLNQTLKAHEIIVVDDGSTDNTPEILKSFDSIKVLRVKNAGVSSARNIGIKEALGEWIALLDSDDEWHRDKLKIQSNFHKQNPHILFSHTHERWIRDNKIVKQKKYHQKPKGFCFEKNLDFCKIAPSTVMIAKSLIEKVGYFDESLEVCEDYDLWLRILRDHELGLVEKILSTKYGGHEQLSLKYHSMDRYRILALLKHKELFNVKEQIKRKIDILSKGAKKHQNIEIIEFCNAILQDL